MAHIESGEVDKVKDFRIGLKPSSAQYIRIADLAVANLSWLRGEREEVRFLKDG